MKRKKLKQIQAYNQGIEFQFVDPVELGPIISHSLKTDPIHMSFVLSRYKFLAKLIGGKKQVLEVGCADAFGTPIVAQFVEKLVALDLDERLIASNIARLAHLKNVSFLAGDFFTYDFREKFEVIYAIDVIEHFDPHLTRPFFEKAASLLSEQGILIIGTPNATAAPYASPQSIIQHINLQSHETLRDWLSHYFHTVFLFGMNDEVVHTGYAPMAHYAWAIGVGVKSKV